MKNILLVTLATIMLTVSECLAQQTQSEIYDAIALLNAVHGLNALLVPQSAGYDIVDPVTGEILDPGAKTTAPAYTANLVLSRQIVVDILARNAGLPAGTPEATVLAAYANNPFLKDILANPPARNAALVNTVKTIPKSDKVGGGTAILDNVVNGTADFLIKRAGEEISASVFEKLQKFIDLHPEFKVLFPKTCALIKPISPYEYANTVNALSEAINSDLEVFPSRIAGLYDLPKYKLLNDEFPALTLIFAGSTVINDAHTKINLSSVLHDLGTQNYLSQQNNYVTFLKGISMLSDGFRKKRLPEAEDGDYDYITQAEFESMTQNDNAFKLEASRYFLGLIFQKCQLKIYNGANSIVVTQLMSAADADITKVMNVTIAAVDKMAALKAELSILKGNENDSEMYANTSKVKSRRFEIYVEFAEQMTQIIEPFTASGAASAAPYLQQITFVKTYWRSIANDAIAVVKDFKTKEYALAIHDFSQLLSVVADFLKDEEDLTGSNLKSTYVAKLATKIGTINVDITALNIQITGLRQSSTAAGVDKAFVKSQIKLLEAKVKTMETEKASLEAQQKNSPKTLFNLSRVFDYMSLLVAISQAEDSEQVEKLLESFALPVGSSRVKKVTDFNIAVNAYVGGFSRPSSDVPDGLTSQYGLTAPIGFTFSHGMNKAGSISLFTGVFDIGATIKYKLDNNGAYVSDISFASILSPSIQLVYGFPFFLPLSVGYGWQWTTPATSANVVQLSPHANLFIAVDIPLFNLAALKKK